MEVCNSLQTLFPGKGNTLFPIVSGLFQFWLSEFAFSLAKGIDQHLGDQQCCFYKHVCPGDDPETCCFWSLWLPSQPLQHLWQYHRHHQVTRALGINWNTRRKEYHRACTLFQKGFSSCTERSWADALGRGLGDQDVFSQDSVLVLHKPHSISVPQFSPLQSGDNCNCLVKFTTNTSCEILWKCTNWRCYKGLKCDKRTCLAGIKCCNPFFIPATCTATFMFLRPKCSFQYIRTSPWYILLSCSDRFSLSPLCTAKAKVKT